MSTNPDHTQLCRLGFRDPQTDLSPGLGLTSISGPNASTVWNSNVPVPATHDFYVSLTTVNNTFLSLAPRKASAKSALDLVQWSLTSEPVVVGTLDNAHQAPFFGPLAETLSTTRGLYLAAVVSDGATDRQDRWALVAAQLTPLRVWSVELQPKLLGEINSIAGIGLPPLSDERPGRW